MEFGFNNSIFVQVYIHVIRKTVNNIVLSSSDELANRVDLQLKVETPRFGSINEWVQVSPLLITLNQFCFEIQSWITSCLSIPARYYYFLPLNDATLDHKKLQM